mmetsp:Transcript_22465/g.73746  ORF Transcript_22465/g.73746 Transcript_22465/m.73746 type:complete len:87 (+) Transcript_22465:32-292(+)
MLLLPIRSLASSFTRNDGMVMTGDLTYSGNSGFVIEDKYNTGISDPEYWNPISINTKYGGGFGTGVTGAAEGGWHLFDGSVDTSIM